MKHSLPLALVCICCTSCYHVYYAPNTAHVPLLSNKGEAKLIGAYGSGSNSEANIGELQLAFAPLNNVGFMVNVFTASKAEDTEDNYEKGNGSYVEAAPGVFMPINRNGRLRAELYAGAGTGSVSNNYGVPSTSVVGIKKFFLQPAIGYKSTFVEIAFTPKISFVAWKVKEDRVLATRYMSDRQDIDYIKQNPRFTAFEPSLILRAGGCNVKGQVAVTRSYVTPKNYAPTEDLVVSIGLSFGINQKEK